ncbi:MAG: cache domain-containing protein [Pandoraea sp.]|nr:cache domain-containing protein [Pandoraea sp.]MDR3398575.1 cache domain-containing protein [Pandoraea sp.]
MSLRQRVLLLTGVILAAVFALIFTLIVIAQRNALVNTKARELANVSGIVMSSLKDREMISAGSAEIIADQQWVAAAFRAGDRDALQRGLFPMLERINAIYGKSILHFYTPPAQSLLFVENPAVPITDFRDTRPMLVAANVRGVAQRGLELGPVGLAIRGVTPVKDDAGMIGVVEYSSDYQEFLRQLSALTNTRMAAFIRDDLWNNARKHGQQFTPERDQVIEGHRAVYSTDWPLTSAVIAADDLEPTRGNRTNARTRDGIDYGVLSMPLTDFSGQQIGYLVAIRSFAELDAAFVDSVRLGFMRVMLGFILCFGAVAMIFSSLLLLPLNMLLEKLRALASGDTDTSLLIPGRTDEVGALFQIAETLRLRMGKDTAKERQ